MNEEEHCGTCDAVKEPEYIFSRSPFDLNNIEFYKIK